MLFATSSQLPAAPPFVLIATCRSLPPFRFIPAKCIVNSTFLYPLRSTFANSIAALFVLIAGLLFVFTFPS